MIWGYFITTKFGLWVDICSSTANTLNSSGRLLEKSGVLFQTEKAAKSSDDDPKYHVLSLEDAVAYLTIGNPTKILAIEK